MRVFVLCTGRCASKTFAAACLRMTNYTVGHESLATGKVGKNRLAYPDNHVEVDNRLSWMLGRLGDEFGQDPFYVHLTRDRELVARSFLGRVSNEKGIIHGYAVNVLGGAPLEMETCRDFVDTVEANIRLFLRSRKNVLEVRVSRFAEDFSAMWKAIGAEGDLMEAIADLEVTRR